MRLHFILLLVAIFIAIPAFMQTKQMDTDVLKSGKGELSVTAQKAIAAYGGDSVWKEYKFIVAEVSANGLAFKMKKRPAFNHAIITMQIHKPYSSITPIGSDSLLSGVLDGGDVYLMNEHQDTIASRKNARDFFPGWKKMFRWDDLDMAYFANYAFWNYFTLPNLLMDSTIIWTETQPGTLVAEFPNSIPTHSRTQEFIFDTNSGLLIQHNYTVDIIGKWSRAANVVYQHNNAQVLYTSHRLVTPRKRNGNPRPKPTLIEITVHNFKLIK